MADQFTGTKSLSFAVAPPRRRAEKPDETEQVSEGGATDPVGGSTVPEGGREPENGS